MAAALQPRTSTHHLALYATSAEEDLPGRRATGSFYTWMLERDFEQQQYAYELVLEYRGVQRSRGDRVISDLLRELGRHRHDAGTKLFLKLVSEVARGHLTYGRSVFELFKDAETQRPRLGLLPGWSLRRRRKGMFQATPIAGRVQWRQLPAVTLIEFLLPGRLGIDLYRTRKRLRILDAYRAGNPGMLDRVRATGYDFGAHDRVLDEMAAKATMAIGWHGSDSFMRRGTDSYKVYRRLRFLRTWLIVVTTAAETLNRVCAHPEISAGTSLRLHVTGLPTIEEVDRSIIAVTAGTQPLDEISRTILHPRYART